MKNFKLIVSIIITTIIITVSVLLYAVATAVSIPAVMASETSLEVPIVDIMVWDTNPCDALIGTQNEVTAYDCATPELRQKWNEYEKNTFDAIISKYSPIETCHGGDINKCITASGSTVLEGLTLACPRRYTFGTKFLIDSHEYTCTDRTARWIEEKYPNTFDIFTTNYEAAIAYGRRGMEITVLDK